MNTQVRPPHVASPVEQPIPRRIPFEFPDDLNPVWHPTDPEFSAMVNGASLVMPYLEPFLIRTMREALPQVDDAAVAESGRAFNTQEQHHYQAHRRYNELLKRSRYPQLAAIEADMVASYARLSKRDLRARLAYTAGFEAMTLGVTRWLVDERRTLFGGSDSRVASFVLWHFVEESEHKCVAHDVWHALHGADRGGVWLARAIGVLHGSLDVMWYSMRGYRAILKHDGRWWSPRSRLRLFRRLMGFVGTVAPYLCRALLPGHDPRQERDPQWVEDWMAGYAAAPPAGVPLLDTAHPDLPVPFPNPASRSSFSPSAGTPA
jgi:predicted metal-dependent hydrolase